MNLREKLFVEVRKGTKVTLSESDLNKMDRMYERDRKSTRLNSSHYA